jgi:hypothetical protein
LANPFSSGVTPTFFGTKLRIQFGSARFDPFEHTWRAFAAGSWSLRGTYDDRNSRSPGFETFEIEASYASPTVPVSEVPVCMSNIRLLPPT